MYQGQNHKRKTPTILSSLCGRLQIAVDEALESPAKLSRLNTDSRYLVAQECARTVPWLQKQESGELLVAELEEWWSNGLGSSLKLSSESSQSALVSSLTAFRSLLDYLDQCLRNSKRLLPPAMAKLLIQTFAAQLMQFLKNPALQKLPQSTSQVLIALTYLCLARINGLCSTQQVEAHASQEGRKCSTAALSEFLIAELQNLFVKNEHALCLVIIASFGQSLHRAIIHDAAWRSGFKPALQQLATLALRISLDGSCHGGHSNLAREARRTLALLTWKAIKGNLCIQGVPDDPNLSAFEWAMQSCVMSLQAHVASLQRFITCRVKSSNLTTSGDSTESVAAPTAMESSPLGQMTDSSPTTDMTFLHLPSLDLGDGQKGETLSLIKTLMKGISASFYTIKTLLEYGGDCSPSSIGEEAFGNLRYHALECGISILKVDTISLWPTLMQCAQLIVQLCQHRHEFTLEVDSLRSFYRDFCHVLGCLIDSFPPAKAAMFSKFLQRILCILLVDFDGPESCLQVLCLSNRSLANLMDIISRRIPSFFVSTMPANEESFTGDLREWQKENAQRIQMHEQLSHSAFTLLRRLRVDLPRACAEGSIIQIVASMHEPTHESDQVLESTSVMQSSQASEHPLTKLHVCETICTCILELFDIIACSRRHGSHMLSKLKPSVIEEELEVVWFLFRGLEAIQNIKGSALAYKSIGNLLMSKKRSFENSNTQLGNTLAWLNLLHQLLLANEASGFATLLRLTRTIMIPATSISTQRLVKGKSAFLSATIALLCQWEKEFMSGHLRSVVKGTTLVDLHDLLEDLRSLEPRTAVLSTWSERGEINEKIDKYAVLRRLIASPSDSLAGLVEHLEDAWAGVIALTLSGTNSEQAAYSLASGVRTEMPRHNDFHSASSTSLNPLPSHLQPSKIPVDHNNRLQNSSQSQDDYDHLFEEADEEDDEAESEEEQDLGGMDDDDVVGDEEVDDDSDVTLTSPEESPSEPRQSEDHRHTTSYSRQPQFTHQYQRGEKSILPSRSCESSDVQEIYSDHSSRKSRAKDLDGAPPVPHELMTIDEDEDVSFNEGGATQGAEPTNVTSQSDGGSQQDYLSNQEEVSQQGLESQEDDMSQEDTAMDDKGGGYASPVSSSRSKVDVSMTPSQLVNDAKSEAAAAPAAKEGETLDVGTTDDMERGPMVIAMTQEASSDEASQRDNAMITVLHVINSGFCNDGVQKSSDRPSEPSSQDGEGLYREANEKPPHSARVETNTNNMETAVCAPSEGAEPVDFVGRVTEMVSADPLRSGDVGGTSATHPVEVEPVTTPQTMESEHMPVHEACAQADGNALTDAMEEIQQALVEIESVGRSASASPHEPLPLEVLSTDSYSRDEELNQSAQLSSTGTSMPSCDTEGKRGMYTPFKVIADDEGAVLLTDDELGDDDEEESVTITDPIVVNIGTPEVGALDDLRVPSHLIDSPKSFDSGMSSPSGYDTRLLEDKNEEYLTSLAQSHDISDNEH